jgi:tRNA pseudouridine38-40 synthase|tara:strand:- start:22597 stop:23331 length:735 start_codon:yes stop_codon:yes gene_type:complete
VATIQDAVQNSLGAVADHQVTLTCAGRTDAGVHATCQVTNFDTHASRSLKAWVLGTNAHLPDTISVNWVREVPPGFDARFSAASRRYVYVIVNNRNRSGLMSEMVTREHRHLDAALMNKSAQALVGENDFSSFRAASCQSRTAARNIHHISVERSGELVVIDIAANAFLHHMVRNIAGVMLDIGAGEKPASWAGELLALRDRNRASVTAPPNGLYLIQVDYPDYDEMPKGPQLPHFLGSLPIST